MGRMVLRLPKGPVSIQIKEGILILRCPECKELLYFARNSPHDGTKRIIEGHVKLCRARKELVTVLNKAATREVLYG